MRRSLTRVRPRGRALPFPQHDDQQHVDDHREDARFGSEAAAGDPIGPVLQRPVAGLFLLATPSEIPGYRQAFDLRPGVPALLYHGWQDDICPPEGVLAFAQRKRLPLVVVDDDHRLSASVDHIVGQFRLFLESVAASA